jgi:hypothetical protein
MFWELQIETTMVLPLYIHDDGYNKKRWTIINVGEDIRKLEPSYIANENVMQCSCFVKQFDNFTKI